MSISDLYDREARAATDHALFREVNERVKEVNDGYSRAREQQIARG